MGAGKKPSPGSFLWGEKGYRLQTLLIFLWRACDGDTFSTERRRELTHLWLAVRRKEDEVRPGWVAALVRQSHVRCRMSLLTHERHETDRDHLRAEHPSCCGSQVLPVDCRAKSLEPCYENKIVN